MFDSVGRDMDREATVRQLVAMFLTLAALGMSTTVGFLYSVFIVVRAVTAPPIDTDAMVEVAEVEPEMEAPPPPPPPPPPPAASAEEKDVDPEQVVEEVVELKAEIKEEVKPQEAAGGGGVVGGVVGGVEGGVIGGVVGGVIGGQLGPKTFHSSELRIKNQAVQPEYPQAAKDMNLGNVDCKVRMFIDEKGVPFEMKYEACPKVFQDSAHDALMKWRWYPATVGGEKIKAQFVIKITYKLTD